MDKTSNSNKNRRRILSLGLLGGASLLSQKATAMLPIQPEEETVPMLTSDGKLVSVSKQVLEQIEERKKASSQDIHEWTALKNKSEK